jgi:hypothetical protein
MKLILESWRKYLKEGLLTEFDKADRNAVMADADRFTSLMRLNWSRIKTLAMVKVVLI